MRKPLSGILFITIFLPLLLISPTASGQDLSIDGKINSIAHHAEEYEVGNINYMQLYVHAHTIRAELNLALGGGIGEKDWGRIPVENIKEAFGEPTEMTRWVWVENKHTDKRISEAMPMWERVVFDGRKIQVILNAWPAVVENDDGSYFRFYNIDLRVRFKKSFDINIDSMLGEVNELILRYNTTQSMEDGRALVEKTVGYERLIRNFFHQNSENCITAMEKFFDPEDKRPEEKLVRWEVFLYRGENFDIMANVEMCDDCEWNWIHMHMWIEGRMPMFKEMGMGEKGLEFDDKSFREMNIEDLNSQIKR
ncbi:MAG: hypothetical protein ACXABY_16390, partial [Candidatus Thorarchaeota archaeon]